MKVSGGDKFEEALKRIAGQLGKAGTLRVGFLEGATYAVGVDKKGVKWSGGQSVAEVAFFNEYGRTVKTRGEDAGGGVTEGTYYQLPRPFFRNMIAKYSDSWPNAIALNLKAQNYDVPKVMNLAGEGIKGQLQQSIRDTNSPPLAPATIARKGFSKPLIDSGHMFNSVDYQVKT